MYNELATRALFGASDSPILRLLYEYEYPWLAIPHIEEMILEISATLNPSDFYTPSDGVWISKSARVADSAKIGAPTIIMPNAEIRHSAFIRRGAFIDTGATVGNSTEIKNAILLPCSAAPHFNYLGDSILGSRAHLGAGVICSNLRLDKKAVTIYHDGERIDTALRKLGAIVGDCAEIGCSSVLNPGTIILPHSTIPPLSSIRGIH